MIVLLRNADFSILKKPRHLKELTYRDAGHSNQIQLGQAVGDPKEIVEDMKTLGGHLQQQRDKSIDHLNPYRYFVLYFYQNQAMFRIWIHAESELAGFLDPDPGSLKAVKM